MVVGACWWCRISWRHWNYVFVVPFHFAEIIAGPSHVTQIDDMLLCICLSQYTKRILKFCGTQWPRDHIIMYCTSAFILFIHYIYISLIIRVWTTLSKKISKHRNEKDGSFLSNCVRKTQVENIKASFCFNPRYAYVFQLTSFCMRQRFDAHNEHILYQIFMVFPADMIYRKNPRRCSSEKANFNRWLSMGIFENLNWIQTTYPHSCTRIRKQHCVQNSSVISN